MRRIMVVACVLLALAAPVAAQPKRDVRAEDVKASIDRGVNYLQRIQLGNGSWEIDKVDLTQNITATYPGGKTALALLALLNCGKSPNDPSVSLGLKYLRGIASEKTYVRALQILVYAEANLPEDRLRIQNNVKWLLEARVYVDKVCLGWSYGHRPGKLADNSNTQYAVLALWAAKQAGIEVPDDVFKEIQHFYKTHQAKNGGWNYAVGAEFGILNSVSMTMTSAGLSGLLISGMELNVRREGFTANGTANNCGKYDENPHVQKALEWISINFTPEVENKTFYHLYGLERTGRLSGLRYFGNHDWYREGCQFLVRIQKGDGAWQLAGTLWDPWPEVSTSFALLFLSKGRTPVLISKLVHGAWPRVEADSDWNNDRNDLRHLTSFVSKELFKVPLAWQTIDLSRGLNAQARGLQVGEDDMQAVTSDMLQSPILYISGHYSPQNRLQGAEKALIKRYVENGGFIFAEACCGKSEFHDGLIDLVKELWPGGSFDKLPADHPVYVSDKYRVPPGQPYELWGLQQGCKTVLVYSPQDLSCRWETGKPDDPDIRTQLAFRLGANIVAYATGMEPPPPRLKQVPVAANRAIPDSPPRGYVQIAQLRIPGESPPAPKAMRNLLEHAQAYAGIDVHLATKQLLADSESVKNYKFVYMHGRKEFNFDPQDLEHLRFNLESGGLLFADACCGKEAFDKSFRKFVGQLLPKGKLEQVPLNDELFGADLNGEALTDQNIECRTEAGAPLKRIAPYLEGIKHQGRWVVLYSKYDIGCALERHQSSDCRGYNPASAQRIARAAILYTLRP